MYAMPAIKHAAAEYWRSKLCMLYKPQCFGPCCVAILNVLYYIAYQTWQADDPVPAVIHVYYYTRTQSINIRTKPGRLTTLYQL